MSHIRHNSVKIISICNDSSRLNWPGICSLGGVPQYQHVAKRRAIEDLAYRSFTRRRVKKLSCEAIWFVSVSCEGIALKNNVRRDKKRCSHEDVLHLRARHHQLRASHHAAGAEDLVHAGQLSPSGSHHHRRIRETQF